MVSHGSTYFNAVLQYFHPHVPVGNPLILSFHDTEIKRPRSKSIHIRTTKSSFAVVDNQSRASFPKSDSDAFGSDDEKETTQEIDQVVLVEIHNAHTVREGAVETTQTSQHFNLAILDSDESLFLFEPLQSGVNNRVHKLVQAHFPDYSLKLFPCHPQKNTKADHFCMAYVLMLANEVLHENVAGATFNQRCYDVFFDKTIKDAKLFTQLVAKKIKHLPPFPTGAGDAIERNSGAILGGSIGMLAMGPVGLLGGAFLGHVIHDDKDKEAYK